MAKYTEVLFITESRGFLVNNIINEMGDAGLRLFITGMNVNEIKALPHLPGTVVLNILGKVVGLKSVLDLLRDYPSDDNTRMYLIGEASDFRHVYEMIPEEYFSGIYARPVNTKELIRQIEEDRQHDAERAEKEAEAKARKKILIVDDDATLLRMMKNFFSKKYDVVIISSGREAIDFFEENTVDLVLLDFEMPEVNGPVVLRNLKTMKNAKDVPVMFLTAKTDRESIIQAVSLKPEKYLLKSTTGTELLQIIDDFFASREK